MTRVPATILCIVWFVASGICQQHSEVDLTWPKPPDKPRIRFLYAIAGKQDLGIEKSFWKKLADALFGEEKEMNSMIRPQGIAVDARGRIYVTDIGTKGVHVFDLAEKEHTLITGSDDHRLVSPVGIAVSQEGMIYVSDSELGAVVVFDQGGDYEFAFSNGLKRPTGICLGAGLLYVTDTESNQVVGFDIEGNEKFRVGSRGLKNGEFNFPTYVCADDSVKPGESSNLYVVDAMNFQLQTLRHSGTFLSRFGKLGDGIGDFARPKGVALDSEGHIYVADALFDVVQVFDENGQVLLAFGGSGNGFGSFYLPAGVAVDKQDRIYVVDSGNRRVQVFQYLR